MGSPSHPAGPGDPGALVEHTLRESLRTFVHSSWMDSLLQRALRASGEPDVPPGGERLRRFLTAVVATVRSAVGDAEAEALADDLSRILALAPDDDEISHVRSVSERPERPDARLPVTEPPFAEHDGGPAPRTVLLASRTATRGERLAALLPATWQLRTVPDALALLEAAAAGDRAPILVLDYDHPSVQPATLGALSPELPDGTRVIVWGSSDADLEGLQRISAPARAWVASEPGASEERLAALIAGLEG